MSALSAGAGRIRAPLSRTKFKFLSVARSHVGKVRDLNEDAVLSRAEVGLFAVADGMGGHARGALAAGDVVDALGRIGACGSAYALRDAVTRAMSGVNARLVANAADGVCGSTLVTLLVHEGHFACMWAGDSRAYLYRGGVLKRLTHDHSEVQNLVDAGLIQADQARNHPRANVITRAVGAHPTLKLDDVYGVIAPGDRFLLCSDGLHGAVSEPSIAALMRRAPLECAASSLIDAALARGGRDNVSVVLVTAESSAA